MIFAFIVTLPPSPGSILQKIKEKSRATLTKTAQNAIIYRLECAHRLLFIQVSLRSPKPLAQRGAVQRQAVAIPQSGTPLFLLHQPVTRDKGIPASGKIRFL